MSNDTVAAILDYAERHGDFSIGELFVYLNGMIGISKSSLSWYLFKLVNDRTLVRTGRGHYLKTLKQRFAPLPSGEVREIYEVLNTDFPFAGFCIYQGEIIAAMQHHLSPNHTVYVEVERNAVETVFNFLKSKGYNVYFRPDEEMIYRYVDMSRHNVFVKNLVSESPLQNIDGIPMPSLEKLLVDILRDSDFFYLRGGESERIIRSAFALYAINRSRLLRYAGRRKAKEELLSILKNQAIE